MTRRILASLLATLAIGTSFVTSPARGEPYAAREPLAAFQLARSEAGRYGPFPTARRANEAANYYRSRGYDAHVYSEWGDYYVAVR